MVNKIIGYLIAAIGLLAIVFSSGKAKAMLPFLKNINSNYIIIAGSILVLIGIFLLIQTNKGSSKQSVEVPIYEGKGKKRRVVAYQRE